MTAHLVRRGALYHFRRRLPPPLNRLLSQSHYRLSLGTPDPERARRLARRLAVAIDLIAERLAIMPRDRTPTPGQLNLALKRVFDDILADGERRRGALGGAPPSCPSGNRENILEGRATRDDLEMLAAARANGEFDELPEKTVEKWEGHAEGGLTDYVQEMLGAALAALNLSVAPSDAAFRELSLDATKVAAAAYKVEVQRWDGRYEADQTPPAWIDRKYPLAPTLIRSWAGNLTPDEVNFLARTIKDVGEEFIQRHLKQQPRAAKTERDWRTSLRYFVELVGNLRMGDITEVQVDQFREKLRDVPRSIGKGEFSGIKASDAVANAAKLRRTLSQARAAGADHVIFDGRRLGIEEAAAKAEGMTMKTANKHLSFFTSLWRSRVVPSALRPTNPFAGSLYKKRELAAEAAASVERAAYTSAELRRLFRSPVWAGGRSLKRRTEWGPHIYPDARFWCPLIAAFTGMRREEICQLKGSDFDWHAGIWFLRVQPTEGRRLKSLGSRRDIPIHSELIKIGLQEFVAHRESGFLFPELVPSAVDGSRGDPLGKWFFHYRRAAAVGLRREETDFHSFRTTFSSRMRDAGVPLDQVRPITGHQETDVMAVHYARGLSLEQKKIVIERLRFGEPFDTLFGHLYGRMPELLRLYRAVAPPPRAPARRRRRK
jgi:integrase